MIAAHMFIILIISSVLNCTYRKTNQLSKLFNYRLNYCYMLRVKLFVVVVQVLVCVVYHWKYCTGRLAKIHRQDVFILYSTFRFSLKWRGTEIILRQCFFHLDVGTSEISHSIQDNGSLVPRVRKEVRDSGTRHDVSCF